MSFKRDDVVKVDGNLEPCVVYRVLDNIEQMVWLSAKQREVPHTHLEVIGWFPTEYLTPAKEHKGNVFGLDKALSIQANQN